MKAIKVKDIMTAEPFFVRPTQTVWDAAKLMKVAECGVLPVGDSEKVIGMITDRDIVIRAISEGKNPETTIVQDIMTKKVYGCDESDDIEQAAEQMRKNRVSRLIVSKGKKITGIVSSACLLRNEGEVLQSNKILHELLGCGTHSEAAGKKIMAGSNCD